MEVLLNSSAQKFPKGLPCLWYLFQQITPGCEHTQYPFLILLSSQQSPCVVNWAERGEATTCQSICRPFPPLKRCLQSLNVEHDVYQDQKPSNILTGKLEKIGVVSSAYYSPLHSDSSQKHFLNIRMSDISLFCSEALFLHSGSTGTQILSRKVRVSQPLPINSPPLSCRTIAELF